MCKKKTESGEQNNFNEIQFMNIKVIVHVHITNKVCDF